jgi:hypothetical protein
MSLQSLFNFMIGEFYVRTLSPLHLLMTLQNNSGTNTPLPHEQDIQFYVHLSHGGQNFYDGHKLLLNGMLSREDAAEVKSMVDLFDTVNENNQDDVSDCECFEKMVFCGYDVYAETLSTVDSVDNHTPDPNLNYTLWNEANTAGDLERVGYCGKDQINIDLYSCDEWADLRHFLASNLQKHYPTLEKDVLNYRKDTLIRRGFVDKNYNGTTKEWIFVGLAQRSYRRSWINLPQVMEECNSLHSQKGTKVVCVEINVETTLNPYEQLILHRSVNGLIGVHGAQMTQAVLLPNHGHILELLPWIPEKYNIRGSWVQTRHSPTPLGIIFHNTDLYHVGYSLGRDSVPLCEGIGELGSDEEKECLTKGENRKRFIWESRDFNVNPSVILQYIEQFLLIKENEKLCSNMVNALDDEFVLYNVWCESNEETTSKIISPFDPKLMLHHDYDSTPDRRKRRAHSSSSVGKQTDLTSTDIDIVSLTVEDDFFILFNNSAITSWMDYIQGIRSITFIGPPSHYSSFAQNLKAQHASIYSKAKAASIPIRWVNETHWTTTYKNKYRCGYPGVCQQLIKLHVFDLKTHLGLDYLGNNILIVDSDTVWSREVTFIHPNNTLTYFERVSDDEDERDCDDSDPIRFTEAITIGTHGIEVASEDADEFNHRHTQTPYKSCRRSQYPDATGGRHIVHFMLFQQDVMEHLHETITKAWGVSNLWKAATTCHKYSFCKGRIAEYELYYAFMLNFYPERMHIEHLISGKDWMNSAICDVEEMECCREKNVLLKGCHDHRIKNYELGDDPGDMCCGRYIVDA